VIAPDGRFSERSIGSDAHEGWTQSMGLFVGGELGEATATAPIPEPSTLLLARWPVGLRLA
jgi:hypothetical protein